VALLEFFRADRDEHGLTAHAEHGHDEHGLRVGEVVPVLVVDQVAAGFPEGLTGLDNPWGLTLQFEDHLAFDDIALGRAGMPMRRRARATRREGDPERHLLGVLRNRRRVRHRREHIELERWGGDS
jgi:hypothetical protein